MMTMTRSNGINDAPFLGVDSLASASSPLGVRKEDPLPEHDIVPGQFDDAEPQDHDFNHHVSGNEATLFPDLATSAPSTTDATSKPSDHVRDIVLGFKSGTKTPSGEMKGTANAAPSPAKRLAAERQLLSPAFPTRTNDNQRFRIPQQPRRNPAHQNVPYGQPYVDIKPKPPLETKKYVSQQCIAVSATNPHAPPFIWSYSPNKRQKVKQPFARLDELDQHPHPLLLPAGVAPLLQKHGHFVAPADGSTGFPLHNYVDPDPVTRILSPTSRDILMGRTKNAPKHPGNVFYRDIVTKYKQAYKVAAKGDKKLLAANLVNYFRVRNGRFLQEHEGLDNNSPRTWYHEVGNAEAIKKLSQSLRGGGLIMTAAAAEKVDSDAVDAEVSFEGHIRSRENVDSICPRIEVVVPTASRSLELKVCSLGSVLGTESTNQLEPSQKPASLLIGCNGANEQFKLCGIVNRATASRTNSPQR